MHFRVDLKKVVARWGLIRPQLRNFLAVDCPAIFAPDYVRAAATVRAHTFLAFVAPVLLVRVLSFPESDTWLVLTFIGLERDVIMG